MNLTIEKRELARIAKAAGAAVASRATLPIMGHVRLETIAGRLLATGGDLEQYIMDSAECKVGEEGAIAVPSNLFGQIVDGLPPQQVVLTASELNSLNIACGGVSYDLLGLPADEYPMLPAVDGTRLELPQGTMRHALDKVVYAASTDGTRVLLTGVLIKTGGHKLVMAATDGYRLARLQVAMEAEETEAIIPARALNLLQRRLAGGDGEQVVTTIASNHARFEVGDWCMISRLIEGQYPAYEKFTTMEYTQAWKVNRHNLLTSCRRAMVVARSEADRLILSANGAKLIVKAETAQVGSFSEIVPLVAETQKLEVGVNGEFMIDALNATEGEEIKLELISEVSPIKITGDDTGYVAVVMPMQVK